VAAGAASKAGFGSEALMALVLLAHDEPLAALTLAAGRKAKSASTPHPVFPAGGCTTCAGPSPQGCSASARASKSPRRCSTI
jgi:hypothetical protein